MIRIRSRTVALVVVLLVIAAGSLWVGGSPQNQTPEEHDLRDSGDKINSSSGTESEIPLPETSDSTEERDVRQIIKQNESGYRFVEDTEAGIDYEGGYPDYVEGNDNPGVYVTDFDNDGYPDVLVNANDGPVLFRNEDGTFYPSDSLPDTGVDVDGALFFDYDNDGYDDLYLLSDEGSVFYENERGVFSEKEVGLEVEFPSARGAAAADYTGNGCLDVFVVQANNWSEHRPAGHDELDVSIEEDNGEANRLFAGDCEVFEEKTDEAGIHGEAWSLATSFVDLTNDGNPDIHVANDFNNDVLYLNQGNGSFDRNVMPEFTNRNGMSSEVADVTGNGYLDIFVTNIYTGTYESSSGYRIGGRTRGNNLLLNQGNGSFVDAAEEYGVQDGGWGWAALIEDFNNNGNNDLFHTTAFGTKIDSSKLWLGDSYGFEEQKSKTELLLRLDEAKREINETEERLEKLRRAEDIPRREQNMEALEDRIEELESDVSRISDELTEVNDSGYDAPGFLPSESVSAASLDYDLDGSVDIIESAVVERYKLYTNRENGSYLRITVDNLGRHTTVGTRVYVEAGGEEQMRVKTSRTDYMSQSSRVLHFGLADADTVDELRVVFPDGTECTFERIEPNQRATVYPDCELVLDT